MAAEKFRLIFCLENIIWHSLQKHGYTKIWIQFRFRYQTARHIAMIKNRGISKNMRLDEFLNMITTNNLEQSTIEGSHVFEFLWLKLVIDGKIIVFVLAYYPFF